MKWEENYLGPSSRAGYCSGFLSSNQFFFTLTQKLERLDDLAGGDDVRRSQVEFAGTTAAGEENNHLTR